MAYQYEQDKCPHSRGGGGKWVENPDHDPEEYAIGGYDLGPYEWQESYSESTFGDIDLHRMRCSMCGKIKYYSTAARLFYEEGIESPYIKGLQHSS